MIPRHVLTLVMTAILAFSSLGVTNPAPSALPPAQSGVSAAAVGSLEDIATRSDTIVVGSITGTRSYWNTEHNLIYTDATVSLEDTLKGQAAQQLTVTVLGGQVQDMTLSVSEAAAFQPGDRSVLFLKRNADGSYATIDGSRGKRMVEDDMVADTSLLQFVAQVKAATGVSGQSLSAGAAYIKREPITLTFPGTPAASAPAQQTVSTQAGWQTVMTQTFEGSFPGTGTGWAVEGNPTWGATNYMANSGSYYSAWPAKGGDAGLDPATSNYADNMDAWMIYGPFSLSDATDGELSYALWLDTEYGVDPFIVAASLGSSFNGYAASGNSGGWVQDSFDLKDFGDLGNLTGQDQVWIAFGFQSNGSVTAKGAFVDDIKIEKYVGPRPAISEIAPPSASAGTDTQVTISGSNFGVNQGAGNVTFYYQDGEPRIEAPVVSWSDTSIVVKVPVGTINGYSATAGSGPVIVTSDTGGASDGYQFGVTFSYKGKKWTGSHPQIHYRVNSNAPNLTGEEVAFQAAAQAWSDMDGAGFDFVYDGATSAIAGTGNGVNEMLWRDLGAANQGVIAWAMGWSSGSYIVEYDIEFNTYFTWSTAAAGEAGKMDVQNIATHELGHALGLRDLYGDTGTPNDKEKTMYGRGSTGETKKRSLDPADIAGIRWVYPGNFAPTVTVTYPNGGEKLTGTVTVTADAGDPDGAEGTVAEVAFEYSSDNGTNWNAIATDTTSPYSVSWDTTGLTDGAQYLIRATATDNDSGTAQDVSDAVFTVENNQPPTVAVTYPNGGEKVNGIVTVTADASDPGGNAWATYNVSNSGLASEGVWAIAIDNTGNKWFGTNRGGVSKFDGATWTTYNTSNSGLIYAQVLAIAIDSAGNKWFGTSGVSKFDGTNWTTYTASNSGLANGAVNAIAIDSIGNKWFGIQYGGVSKFDGANWTTYNTSNSGLASNAVLSVSFDGTRGWFGTSGGVNTFDGTNWTTYNTSNSGLANGAVKAIAIDGAGNKWFGTSGGGVSKFDGANWTTYNTSNSGLVSGYVTAIAIDGTGNKWFGTDNNDGVSKFGGANWTTYNTFNSGLASNSVQAVAIDSSGNKWFGTYNDGVSKFGGGISQVAFEYSSNNGVTWNAIDTDTTAPYSVSWDTATLTDGTQYLIRATATDNQDATASDTSDAVFTVDNNQPPTVAVTYPNGGEKVKGTVTVTGDAGDADGTVSQVAFEYSTNNGATWTTIATDTTSPYSASWNTAALADGSQYLVRATARDDKDITTSDTSDAVFRVDNTAPAAPNLLSPLDGAFTASATPTLDWYDVSDPSGITYDLQIDDDPAFGSPFIDVNSLSASDYASGAIPNGTYNWRVRTIDGAGNTGAWSASRSFTIAAGVLWWKAQLKAAAGAVNDNDNYAGVAADAVNQSDSYDVLKPAAPAPPYVRLDFPHGDWPENPGDYAEDIRPPAGYLSWPFEVTSSSEGDVTLTWDVTQVPQTYQSVSLLDGATGEVLMPFMRSAASYTYSAQAGAPRSFKFVAAQSSTILAAGWNMLSLPADLTAAGNDFADPTVFGNEYPGGTSLYIYWFNPTGGAYNMWSPASKIFGPEMGKGYWLRAYSEMAIDVSGYPAPDQDYVVHLNPGWNQIGQPFGYSVPWGSAMVSYQGSTVGIEQASANSWVLKFLYRYDPAAGSYVTDSAPAGSLDPWKGYWVKALVEADLIIPHNPAP